MKTIMKNFVMATSLIAVGGIFPACSCGDDDDDNGNNPDAADNVDAPTVDADPNAFPTLGTQIDRSGRPAITSALIKGIIFTDDNDRNSFRDMYNADDDPSSWAADYAAEIALHLGVLDSLENADGNGCGNQFAFDDVNNNYAPLAAVLSADTLLINTTTTTCNQYLAVEAGVTTDCGGRTPLMDVIDTTYSVLAVGALTGVVDNVPPTATANITAFPFLGEPLAGN